MRRLPLALTGGRCAAGTGRPEVSRLGGGGSGSCPRAEGRIPGGEVAAPAPRPAPPFAGERGVAARLPPQPSSPQQPSTLQSGAHGSPARRVEAVRERGAREGPAAAGQRPPSSLRRAAAAGAPQLRGGPASRNARTTRRRSGAPRGSASAFPLSPARLHRPRPARGGGVGASRLCARRPRGPAAGRGARVSGGCGALLRALRRGGENPRTLEVARGGRDSAVASGAGGREGL